MQPLLIFLVLVLGCLSQLYNHQSSSTFNATWMSNLDNGIPLR